MVATQSRMAAEEEFPVRLPGQLVQDFHAAFGEHHARAVHTKGEGATKSSDYLSEELAAGVAANPVGFTWYAQIAEDSDVIDDPATPWPHNRQCVPLGQIVINQVGPNSPEADRSLAFMPGNLPPGIGMADPMLTIRNASYPHSFQERNS